MLYFSSFIQILYIYIYICHAHIKIKGYVKYVLFVDIVFIQALMISVSQTYGFQGHKRQHPAYKKPFIKNFSTH